MTGPGATGVTAADFSGWPTRSTHAERVVAQRTAAVPHDHLPDLPVSERRDEIAAAIRDHQVVVVAGETGSGKTTQLPKICLELGRGIRGTIGHTQPRRLAARTVAQRIADELGTPLGDAVGYTVRFTDQVSDRTLVKLMTDGILLAEIQRDRRLLRYDTLILDEAHERSLNIDFLLGYLRELLPRRPDLKVIVTSATIEPERFAAALRAAAPDRRGVRAHLSGRDPLPPTGSPRRRRRTTTIRTTPTTRSCTGQSARPDRGASSTPSMNSSRNRPATCWSSCPASAKSATPPSFARRLELHEHRGAAAVRTAADRRTAAGLRTAHRTARSCWPPTSPRRR